jgi:CelD/BcsL family acetyltransferase involved in cellulose biosynthesis
MVHRNPCPPKYRVPNMSTSAEWVSDRERFAALAASWETLVKGWGTPFDRHPWFAAWWDAFAARRKLRICALWDEGELVAILPLCRRGRALEPMANVHSPFFRPLARDETALRTLLAEVFREARGGLVLPAVPVDDPSFQALREAAAPARWMWIDEATHTSPIVEIDGSYEAYRERMRSRWSSAERKARKMRREYRARFELVAPPTNLEAQLRRGFAVEASGWKGRAGTAIESSAETLTFYRSVAAAFERTGELRLSEISLDGRTVAFDLSLLSDGRLYLLKTGYDEAYGWLSPGLVLQQEVVETCFGLGLDAYELLGDEADWKRRFATASRAHRDARAYERTPAQVTRYAYRRLARPRLRSAYRTLRAARSAA